MNELVKTLAKPHLQHERWTRYGESTLEEYYDFYPDELQEFVVKIVEECCSLIHDPNKYSDGDFAKYRIRKHFGMEK